MIAGLALLCAAVVLLLPVSANASHPAYTVDEDLGTQIPLEHTYPDQTAGRQYFAWESTFNGYLVVETCIGGKRYTSFGYLLSAETNSRHVDETISTKCGPQHFRVYPGERFIVMALAEEDVEHGYFALDKIEAAPNDRPETAEILPSAPELTIRGNTELATYDPEIGVEPQPSYPYQGLWYSWTAPSTGGYMLSACESKSGIVADSILVFESTPEGPKPLRGAGSRDEMQSCGPFNYRRSQVQAAIKGGTEYLILIADGYYSGPLEVKLSKLLDTLPDNDRIANARDLGDKYPLKLKGQMVGASWSEEDAISSRRRGFRDVWYRWKSRWDGKLKLNRCNNDAVEVTIYENRDGKLKERSNSCRNANGKRRSRSFSLTAGEQYVIRVWTAEPTYQRFLVHMKAENGEPSLRSGVLSETTSPGAKPRVESLPIGKAPGEKERSVASIDLNKFEDLERGVLAATGSLQVSVCLARQGNCFGDRYGYDPRISAHLVLADAPGKTSGRGVQRLSGNRSLTCAQKVSASNHHCSISIPWKRSFMPQLSKSADCIPKRCFVNLVASANHPQAGDGDRVVIGGLGRGGKIDSKAEAQVDAVLYFKKRLTKSKPKRTTKEKVRRLPLSPAGKAPKRKVVYSVKIAKPRKGEVLIVDSRYIADLRGLPYAARTRSGLILAGSPKATGTGGEYASRLTRGSTRISHEANFNCTKGKSGHTSPCPSYRSGVIKISKSAKKPLYVNLVAAEGAVGPGSDRWKSSDRVTAGQGYLRVYRHGRDCAAGGSNFDPAPGYCPKRQARG